MNPYDDFSEKPSSAGEGESTGPVPEDIAEDTQGAAPQEEPPRMDEPYSEPAGPVPPPQVPFGATQQMNVPQQPYYPPSGNPYPGTGYTNQPPQGPVLNGGSPGGRPPKKKKNTGLIVFLVLLGIAIIAGIAGLVYALKDIDSGDEGGNDQTPKTSEKQNGGSADINSEDSPEPPAKKANSEELTAVGVADKVKNSVVGITAYNQQSNLNGFGASQGGAGGNGSSTAGEGSGVLIGEDKKNGYTYVATCAHVIDGQDNTFKVELADGTTYDAQVVGYDNQTDIGVLRIRKTGLTLVTLGSSDALKAGQQVIAVGNPGGSAFFGSVTQGIVSAIDRPIDSQIGYTNKCIQHDAAINPGNSGGGLFNMYGQLIGINSSKIASTAYEGMGFAVPSSTVKTVVDDLIAKGYVSGRVMLGIQPRSISTYENYYQYVQAGVPKSALVITKILDGSDLLNSQVKQYDIIAGINGKQLDTAEVLNSELAKCKVGDVVTLDMIRIENNKLNKFTVKCKLIENKG